MSKRLVMSSAALCAIVLLSACEAPTGSATPAVAGSGAENCMEAIKRQAGTSTLLGVTTSVSDSGITTVGAETAGGENWSCIAGADGSVDNVMRSNQSRG